MANFDPLVNVYRGLERVAFGGDLERARFALLDQLSDCRSILILGEGDGRCLARLLDAAPAARIHCIDLSPAMLRRAEARIASRDDRARVTFECADAFTDQLPAARYDAVVTMFFLDCFEASDAETLIQRIATALQPQAKWLFADFVLPERGVARWRARVWLAVLYAFFRWQTGLRVRQLPPSERLIKAAGFSEIANRTYQWGLLRSAVFVRGGALTAPRRLEQP